MPSILFFKNIRPTTLLFQEFIVPLQTYIVSATTDHSIYPAFTLTMATVNKVILLGYVSKEPDIRYVDQGVCVAQVRLATTERGYTLASGTQVPDRTEWHNIIFWRKLAETVEKYVKKGNLIYVEGKIQTRSYEDKQGITRYVTEIWADQLELFPAKQE